MEEKNINQNAAREAGQIEAIELHRVLNSIKLDSVFPITTDRHCGRKITAQLARKVFRLHGIKGVSVTAPNYSMAQAVHIRMPQRRDYASLTAWGTIENYATDPTCVANREAEAKLLAILAKAFPNHDDRSETQSDYFDYKWSVA